MLAFTAFSSVSFAQTNFQDIDLNKESNNLSAENEFGVIKWVVKISLNGEKDIELPIF